MENKNNEINSQYKNSSFNMENRNFLTITGVNKVVSFSPTLIVLLVANESLNIAGEGLETIKLNNGEINITGKIVAIKYTSKKISFLKRIFK